MPIYSFGVGNLFGRRTDIANPTPVRFGVLQDVTVDISAKNEKLVGQNQLPVDIARGEIDITVKATMARIQGRAFNDLFWGQAVTPASGEQLIIDEAHTMAAATYTVVQAATFKADMGVFYAATNVQLTRVAPASEVTGSYSVNEVTGVYTFAVGDQTAALLFSYRYGVTTMLQYTLTNQLMGASPTFELNLQENYTNNGGVAGTPFYRFPAVKAGKLAIPFKNTKYTLFSLDMDVFADATGKWAVQSYNE